MTTTRTIILTFSISLLFSALLFVFYFSKTIEVLPWNSEVILTGSYDDSDSGGNSEIKSTVTENEVKLDFCIGGQYEDNYCGVYFEHLEESLFFDISSFDYVNYEIETKKARKIPVTIRAFVDGFTNPDDANSYRVFENHIDIDKRVKNYTLNLKEYHTPEWWFETNTITVDKGHHHFDKVQSFNIEDGIGLKAGDCDSYSIGKITLSRSYNSLIWFFIISNLAIAIFFAVAKFTSKKNKPLVIAYEKQDDPIEVENNDEEIILNYISQHYSDPELTLRHIRKAINIHENLISKAVKDKFDLSFKQYLNTIRLTEAKRLLKETKLNISEIAYKVGYNNVTHFNRVFKGEMEMSPNDFRNKE